MSWGNRWLPIPAGRLEMDLHREVLPEQTKQKTNVPHADQGVAKEYEK
jgi:hypothetical protein